VFRFQAPLRKFCNHSLLETTFVEDSGRVKYCVFTLSSLLCLEAGLGDLSSRK